MSQTAKDELGADVPEELQEQQNKDKESVEDEDFEDDILQKYKDRLDANDNTVFYDMFELIITKISTVQGSIRKVRKVQKALNGKMNVTERNLDVCLQSIDDLDAEVDDLYDTKYEINPISNKM